MVRIATTQFASTTDIQANLHSCLQMIERAAQVQPNLIVLPEFCNRLSWYNNAVEVWEAAVSVDGDFLQAIADQARKQQTHIVVNCTVKRPSRRVTITSFLYDPQGRLLVEADKQTLMGHENIHFSRAEQSTPVVETAVGRLGIYACRDGVTMETARSLALRGAQIFCHSLNSFALDEASLHVPARGLENKVFVVSANKVGPLIPEEVLDDVAAKLGISADCLVGVGESQIVAPDGRVLAKGDQASEMVVWADIDPTEADDKRRPDGTHIFARRRPSLYLAIAQEPKEPEPRPAAAVLHTAVFQPKVDDERAIAEVVQAISAAKEAKVQLLVLPELFCFAGAQVDDVDTAVRRSEQARQAIQQACVGSTIEVCTSLVEKVGAQVRHHGVLLGAEGVIFRQAQLHHGHHPWAELGEAINVCERPWGRLGIIVGDDAIVPEVAKVLAIQGADVLAISFQVQEAWELSHGLVDRSAENRVCVVAATRPSPFGGSLIISQHHDFTIFTPWQTRQFDNTINQPIVTQAPAKAGLTLAAVHPETAQMKVMSQQTDLILGRPWFLADELVETTENP